MADTVEGRIFEALMVHLEAWPEAPLIVYSNVQYPVNGQPKANEYAVVSFSPGTPQAIVLDSMDENKHMGILGVSLLSPLNEGELKPQELGGKLASHFHGQVLSSGSTTVRVTARPRVAGGYVDGDRWRTPVTVPFETITV
jgi:Bacteriophage related domain of unknown function